MWKYGSMVNVLAKNKWEKIPNVSLSSDGPDTGPG